MLLPANTQTNTSIMKNAFMFLVALSLFACKQEKPKKADEISRINFATGGCFGRCPVMAVEMDSSLNFRFYGYEYTKLKGYYTGKISQSFWDSLTTKFEKIDFKQLDSTYEQSVDDLATELIIYYNGQRKHIYGQSMSLPAKLMKLYDWIMDNDTTLHLIKNIDTGNISKWFTTRIQHLPPPPPMPLINQLKVIPPKIKKHPADTLHAPVTK